MNDIDLILLLGIRPGTDGRPVPEMELRTRRAFEVWKKRNVPVICCGADTAGIGVSEACMMKRMLLMMGMPESAVLTEDASRITAENLKNAFRLIPCLSRAALVTSDYHILRARLLARRAGFRVKAFPAHTPFSLAKCKRFILEFLGILDALCGWQDTSARRPNLVERFKAFAVKKLSS